MNKVIVTGAGASVPYGFPTGKGLADRIRELANENRLTKDLLSLSKNYEIQIRTETRQHISEFIDCLTHAGYSTIDEFLSLNPRFEEVGRYSIALALLDCESKRNVFPRHDWYRVLYDQLYSHFKKYPNSNPGLSIITLNYDRSLEFFLATVWKYDPHEEERENFRKYLGKIPIFYAHGSLGALQSLAFDNSASKTDVTHYFKASKGIKIISDNVDEDNQFQECRNILASANTIYFMGFAYHELTMERLFRSSFGDYVLPNAYEIYGTCLGLPPETQQRICSYFPEIILQDIECDKFLSNHPLFARPR